MKRLKIQFWKAEKALAMQILEQEGLPSCKEDGDVNIRCFPFFGPTWVELRGRRKDKDNDIAKISFKTNTGRDEYLRDMTNAITDELFAGKGELKVGEMCEVSDCGDSWEKRRLLAILPKHCKVRFITESNFVDWCSWLYARPLTKRTEPKIEECGQLITYTWEEK